MPLQLFGALRSTRAMRLPAGERVYAIGDVHGEAELLRRLLGDILADSAERCAARTTLVILGDFIDRGDDAADLMRTLARLDNRHVVILKGNHEAALVAAYRGDEEALVHWVRFGGGATLHGLGTPAATIERGDAGELLTEMHAVIDAAMIDWLDALPTSFTLGDYYFAHAGIRPGVALDRQDEGDLLWIREPFLTSRRRHGKTIVHGHSVEEGVPPLGGNRIGIDTGAYEHGQLTALGLEDDRQWILQTSADPAHLAPPRI